MSLFRMNCSFCDGVEVGGIADDDLAGRCSSCDSGRTTFSRATDSGTSSMTDGGMVTSVEVDGLHAVKLGDGGHDLVDGGVAELDEGVLELHAGLLREVAGLVDLVGAEHASLDEDFGEIATGFSHPSNSSRKDHRRKHEPAKLSDRAWERDASS